MSTGPVFMATTVNDNTMYVVLVRARRIPPATLWLVSA
ncbi:hypothetical protein BN979_05328 [Mycolicibacterium vulneris]|nr:hypothetical protein BN979_05328 [Mycolicibacterium vulneris]